MERLDAVAVLYRVAALVADAEPHKQPVRVDHYRQGPYDALLTLSSGRSVGLLRQGPTLPSANLRYRLRSMENLLSKQRPPVTLVLTHADQATRRAVRTLGHPMQHRTIFVATEGELLAGDHTGIVWQQCGAGMGDNPPVKSSPAVPFACSVWPMVLQEGRPLEANGTDRSHPIARGHGRRGNRGGRGVGFGRLAGRAAGTDSWNGPLRQEIPLHLQLADLLVQPGDQGGVVLGLLPLVLAEDADSAFGEGFLPSLNLAWVDFIPGG